MSCGCVWLVVTLPTNARDFSCTITTLLWVTREISASSTRLRFRYWFRRVLRSAPRFRLPPAVSRPDWLVLLLLLFLPNSLCFLLALQFLKMFLCLSSGRGLYRTSTVRSHCRMLSAVSVATFGDSVFICSSLALLYQRTMRPVSKNTKFLRDTVSIYLKLLRAIIVLVKMVFMNIKFFKPIDFLHR